MAASYVMHSGKDRGHPPEGRWPLMECLWKSC